MSIFTWLLSDARRERERARRERAQERTRENELWRALDYLQPTQPASGTKRLRRRRFSWGER